MSLIFRQIRGFCLPLGALLALSGCNGMSEVGFDTKMTLGSVSTVDRCSDFMMRAFPHSFIDVTGSHVETGSQDALVTVQGTRGDVPATSAVAARNVAVECRFQSGVMTSFRWTAGPFRAPASAPAPTSPVIPGRAP
jgi:hypothetical protein